MEKVQTIEHEIDVEYETYMAEYEGYMANALNTFGDRVTFDKIQKILIDDKDLLSDGSIGEASKKSKVSEKTIRDFFTGFALEKLKEHQQSSRKNLKMYIKEYLQGHKSQKRYILVYKKWQIEIAFKEALKEIIKETKSNFEKDIIKAIKK